MPQGIGKPGGDCHRCGEPTTQIGADGGTVGVVCEECDLVTLMPYYDVFVGEHSPRLWPPDDDAAPEDE